MPQRFPTMRISNYRILYQLIFILIAVALLTALPIFGLLYYSLNGVVNTSKSSMETVKTELDAKGQKANDDLTVALTDVGKKSGTMVADLSEQLMVNLSRAIVGEVGGEFNTSFAASRSLGNAVEGYLAGNPIADRSRSELFSMLQAIVERDDTVYAVWVGFEPNAFDNKDAEFKNKKEMGCDAEGRFLPWIRFIDKKIDTEPLEKVDESEFYTMPRKTGQEFVTDPFVYDGVHLMSVAVPVRFEGKIVGVIGIDVLFDKLDKILASFKAFGGNAILIGGSGCVAWHQNKEMIGEDFAKLPERDGLAAAIKNNQPDTKIVKALEFAGTGGDGKKIFKTVDKELYQVMQPAVFGKSKVPWGIIVSAERAKVMENVTRFSAELKILDDESTKDVNTMIEEVGKANTNAIVQLDNDRNSSLRLAAGITALILVLLLIAAVFIGRSFATPIAHSVAILKTVAEKGDLTVSMPETILGRGDEIGDVGRAAKSVVEDYNRVAGAASHLANGNWAININSKSDRDEMNANLAQMLVKVNTALHEVSDTVGRVSTGAREVSSAANNLSSGAQQSAASLEEITASMAEINGQTKQNAKNATEARDLASVASQAAQGGQKAMDEMMAAMGRITSNSDEIQRVIKVIDDIAFQTNLLALNAAVEAARAGQHGKGFAVVAEEVRNLAARSAKAASETNDLIATSGREIHKGGEIASKTAEVLHQIVDQVKKTTDLVAGIANASNEQAQGVAQVTIGLQQIDSVIQQNTASAEESASAANEMSSMASRLQELIGMFKLR